MISKQIVSKQRVTNHGEVFTNPREVNAMLDLVKSETERIDSRFLEPACGKGAFLVEILTRKLEKVASEYRKNSVEYERYAVLAVSSIYGIDILEDNVIDCRQILLDIFKDQYKLNCKKECSSECEQTVRFILSKNIIWGDALALTCVSPPSKPIIFSEWSPVNGKMIKRRDFEFRKILDSSTDGLPLFADTGDQVWLPKPIREFPVTHYLRLKDAEQL